MDCVCQIVSCTYIESFITYPMQSCRPRVRCNSSEYGRIRPYSVFVTQRRRRNFGEICEQRRGGRDAGAHGQGRGRGRAQLMREYGIVDYIMPMAALQRHDVK